MVLLTGASARSEVPPEVPLKVPLEVPLEVPPELGDSCVEEPAFAGVLRGVAELGCLLVVGVVGGWMEVVTEVLRGVTGLGSVLAVESEML